MSDNVQVVEEQLRQIFNKTSINRNGVFKYSQKSIDPATFKALGEIKKANISIFRSGAGVTVVVEPEIN
jgi:hypothetical protein